ncbi:aminopeptidase P family protein [Alphaproteobacteria bacterium]|nr:aminopeptidase P family protein [Alphaproteobacteria bacterium]
MVLKSNLNLLINKMKEKKYDAFLVPRGDVFSGEEVPKNEERLKYISKFSGSAGYAIISSAPKLKSAIFSDGRYEIQLKKEVNSKEFNIFEGGMKEAYYFLKSNHKNLNKIAIDPWLITCAQYEYLRKTLSKTKSQINFIDENLIDKIWINRPNKVEEKIFKLSFKQTGATSSGKINRLKKIIIEHNCDYYILFNPMGLAWLLNIRGKDLKYTPISRSYCIVSKNNEVFIFSENKTFKNLVNKNDKLHLLKPQKLFSFIKKLKNKNFLIDPKYLPLKINHVLESNLINIKTISCPIEKFKSIKNINELNGFKIAHFKDGLAILKLFLWIKKNIDTKHLTEMTISQKLLEIRKLDETFISESFSTISAFNDNGAIVHYKVNKISDKKIDCDGLYLIDSGAHYLEGTTDVTRTLLVGKATFEMIEDYTDVLKGHIAVSTAIFPEKTFGREIDSFARKPLWEKGKDYAHGTGHGVGSLLSVHEGPVSISKHSESYLKCGMVISNEPGYYKRGQYGIRIENLEVVKRKYFKNQNRNFLCFENLTRVPLELDLINKKLLTRSEINWINDYHEKVYKDLSKFIKKDEKQLLKFLKIKTSRI